MRKSVKILSVMLNNGRNNYNRLFKYLKKLERENKKLRDEIKSKEEELDYLLAYRMSIKRDIINGYITFNEKPV